MARYESKRYKILWKNDEGETGEEEGTWSEYEVSTWIKHLETQYTERTYWKEEVSCFRA